MRHVDHFRNTTDFREYRAGAVIFDENEPGRMMYVIKEGEVEIMHNGQVLEIIGPGDIFGEMALVDLMPRSAAAIARTDCKLVPVDNNRFIFLIQETPTFALQVMHTMAERLRRMTKMA